MNSSREPGRKTDGQAKRQLLAAVLPNPANDIFEIGKQQNVIQERK
jgi:hypothetical protein